MATSLSATLSNIKRRIETVNGLLSELKHENQQLRAENENLRHDLEQAIKERDKALLDAEFLSVSHRLAANPDTIVETRRRIAGLIRNIDRCITMLKE